MRYMWSVPWKASYTIKGKECALSVCVMLFFRNKLKGNFHFHSHSHLHSLSHSLFRHSVVSPFDFLMLTLAKSLVAPRRRFGGMVGKTHQNKTKWMFDFHARCRREEGDPLSFLFLEYTKKTTSWTKSKYDERKKNKRKGKLPQVLQLVQLLH